MTQTAKAPTGVSIWNAMREELRLNLYPLPFTTLPPAIFHVYLHPATSIASRGSCRGSSRSCSRRSSDEVRKINQGRGRDRPACCRA